MSVDWTEIGKLGIGIIAIVAILYIVQLFVKSYDANTKALNKLALTLERSSQRELDFQKSVTEIVRDTNVKVSDIHNKFPKMVTERG